MVDTEAVQAAITAVENVLRADHSVAPFQASVVVTALLNLGWRPADSRTEDGS